MCYLGRIALPVNEYISRDVINDGTLGASAHHRDDVQITKQRLRPHCFFPSFLLHPQHYLMNIVYNILRKPVYTFFFFLCFIIRNSSWILLQILKVALWNFDQKFIWDNQLGELGLVFKCYHEFSYIKVFYTMCSNDGHYRNHFY